MQQRCTLKAWPNSHSLHVLGPGIANMNDLLLLTLVCAIGSYALLSRTIKRVRLPPGPSSLPVVGILFGLPVVRPWITFNEWSQKYGKYTQHSLHRYCRITYLPPLGSDVLFLDIPNKPTILLNSYKSVQELMEKRSRNYSDRAVRPIDTL